MEKEMEEEKKEGRMEKKERREEGREAEVTSLRSKAALACPGPGGEASPRELPPDLGEPVGLGKAQALEMFCDLEPLH